MMDGLSEVPVKSFSKSYRKPATCREVHKSIEGDSANLP
ncbi:hypothetical protein AGR4B_Lc10264 [Agrobacterium tumefaciens str. CFBP 5621]|nr:hypothetical protein AGR4B_Lc10264 [Agrobacterium tumefaciens str. CFBP 5621]